MLEQIKQLKEEMNTSEAVVIGAGAGLSTATGFAYDGKRFMQYFPDFYRKYHFENMYAGGFYPYETLEEYWAYWSRYIWVNRYMELPGLVYQTLYDLIKDKDYFVITTNVDHCFQRAGFDKNRLFYTQGDYGLFQCSTPCHQETYDNRQTVMEMVKSQGFSIGDDNEIDIDDFSKIQMKIPKSLVPKCPKCGRPMSMNLRADSTFVQDKGWYRAAKAYELYLKNHQNNKVLFWELGVGYNTPGIIKYPFWQMTAENPKAVYACVNFKEACTVTEIKDRSIVINADIGEVLKTWMSKI